MKWAISVLITQYLFPTCFIPPRLQASIAKNCVMLQLADSYYFHVRISTNDQFYVIHVRIAG